MSEHNLKEIIITNLNHLTNPQLLIIQEFINELNAPIENNDELNSLLENSLHDRKVGRVISSTMFKEKYLR
jgi:hypothetical protein